MKFLAASAGQTWIDTAVPKNATPEQIQEAEDRKRQLERLFTDVLLADNLVVLCGLGTSLSVKDAKGNAVAPTMPNLWLAVEAKAGEQFATIKNKVKYKRPDGGSDNIELLLSHCQLVQTLEPSKEIADFIELAESEIVSACRFIGDGVDLEAHKSFLRKVGRRSTRKPRMKLFTTNYDQSFETAAGKIRFVAIDGFSHTQPQQFDGSYFAYDFVRREQDRDVPDYIPNVFQFFKLHGSVDWERQGLQVIKTPAPAKPLLIYPRLSKFESSYDQPFLEMMSRFQSALRQPNTGVLICGFGFNDNHIVQPILAAAEGNVSLKLMVIDPQLENSANTAIKYLATLIKGNDWRLSLVNARFEEAVSVVPDLIAQSESEQHRQRLSAAGGRP